MPKRARDAGAAGAIASSAAAAAVAAAPAPAPAPAPAAPTPASASEAAAPAPAPAAKALAPAALAAFTAEERAKGLVYLGRVPPGMQPIKVRHLLSRYGEIGRLYLAPEDPAAFKRRVASGGSRRLQFTEGWVEFLDKRVARATAAAVHNAPMEGSGLGRSKRDRFGSELWNIRYLKHFKWHHLTEKVAYERRLRAVKLRGQLAAAKKEADAYLARVDQGKALDAMREKKRGKAAAAGGGGGGGADEAPRRVFKQRKVVGEAPAAADS